MRITKIRAQVRSVCLTGEIWFGEIELDSTEGYLYVTVCDDEGLHYSVSKKSVYDYFINVTDEPSELAEEYHSWQKAKKSKYIKYFEMLRNLRKEFYK